MTEGAAKRIGFSLRDLLVNEYHGGSPMMTDGPDTYVGVHLDLIDRCNFVHLLRYWWVGFELAMEKTWDSEKAKRNRV